MTKKEFFSRPRKISYAIPVLLLLIFVIGIVTRRTIDSYRDQWKQLLPLKEEAIRTAIQAKFSEKLEVLYRKTHQTQNEIAAAFGETHKTNLLLLQLAARHDNNFSFFLFDPKSRLILQSELAPAVSGYLAVLSRVQKGAQFITTPIGTYLVVGMSIQNDAKGLYLYSLIPFETRYPVSTDREYSFTQELEAQLEVSVNPQYFVEEPKNNDGREFIVSVNDTGKQALAWITVQYPSWRGEAQTYSTVMSLIQSILIFLCALILLLAIRPDYKKIKRFWIKPIVVGIILIAMRYLMFYLNLPGSAFTGELSNASYFASKLGGGIVRSPIEFIVTVIFLLGFSFYFFRFSRKEFPKVYSFSRPVYYVLSQLAVAFLLYWLLRGAAASVKSIVFDSTLRYFKGTEIIPDLPNVVMHTGAFLFGISFVLLSISLLFISEKLTGEKNRKRIWLLFPLFHVSGVIYYLFVQQTPLYPDAMVFFAAVVFCFLHILIVFNVFHRQLMIIAVPVLASALIIFSFNIFNIELEQEALKTEALEINRPDENLFRFNLTETLTDGKNLELAKNVITGTGGNYNDLAFVLWSESSLRSSVYASALLVLDKYKRVMGTFYSSDPKKNPSIDYVKALTIPGFFITRVQEKHLKGSDAFIALNPILNGNDICGYLLGMIVYTPFVKPDFTVPPALYNEPVNRASILDGTQLSVFVFQDSLLIGTRGTVELTRELQEGLFRSLKGKTENRITLRGKDEYLYYVTGDTVHNRIIAVGNATKNLDWRLYNVVRILFVHLLIAIATALLYFLYLLPSFFGSFSRRFSFRYQLLLAMLITSIVPLIAVARYNRETVTRKNEIIIQNTLSEKAHLIEKNLVRAKSADAGILLLNYSGIPFSLYKNTRLYYSSEEGKKNGYLPEILPPSVLLQFSESGQNEYTSEDSFGGAQHRIHYRRVSMKSDEYIIQLGTLYNPAGASYSPEEIDVFIIGIYTVASLLMILLGVFFVNRISSPLKTLTAAAEKVSHGDYEILLGKPAYSELGELMSAFEKMSRELKRAQETSAGLERERAWKDFAKQVAHEVKNPLTPMKLTLQQLLLAFKEKPDYFRERFEEYANMLLQQVEILNNIAGEFSAFARMPSVNLKQVNLTSVLQDVVLLYRDQTSVIQLSGELNDIYVLSDTGYLKRSFINLIKNAKQADATLIEINLSLQTDRIIITVTDNGKGIPEEFRDKLFITSFTTKSAGMGLGLKLTKEFFESCYATIELIDTEAGRTGFRISHPVVLDAKLTSSPQSAEPNTDIRDNILKEE